MNYEYIEQILHDKLFVESMTFEGINIEYHSSSFPAKIDELCVRNIPGHFSQVNWPEVPSTTKLFKDMNDTELEISVTPFGNADAPVGDFFAKPYLMNKKFEWLLKKFAESSTKSFYFQSQDDNLQNLNCSAPKSLPLNLRFLGEQKAANLWIGTKGTTSRLHNDNYDNIYIQVGGTKRIYLMPPSSVFDVREQLLKPATYDENMQLVEDLEQTDCILFPTYNPALDPPKRNLYVVDLMPGDILFIPALWYHQVEITSDDVNVSLNYWYTSFDDDRRWSDWNFSRQVLQLLKH